MTDKQEAFKLEYLKDFNGTQAAIRAGYSERTARSIASELLTKPYMQEAIEDYIRDEVGQSCKIIIENIRFWERMRDDTEASETARLKASEHLGKYVVMFTDKKELLHKTLDDNGEETGFQFVDAPIRNADTE